MERGFFLDTTKLDEIAGLLFDHKKALNELENLTLQTKDAYERLRVNFWFFILDDAGWTGNIADLHFMTTPQYQGLLAQLRGGE